MRTFLLAPAFIALALLSHTGQQPRDRCRGRWPAAPVRLSFASGASTLDDLQAQLAQKPTSRGDCGE